MKRFIISLYDSIDALPGKLGIQKSTSIATFWWFICLGWFFIMLTTIALLTSTTTTKLISTTSASVYGWIETVPDSLYPFQQEIEGQFVRGQEAYRNTINSGIALYGENYTSLTIIIYRGAWHMLGSVLILLFLLTYGRRLFPTEVLFYSFAFALLVGLFVQEFVFHPDRYNQTLFKGVIDIMTWLTPLIIYGLYVYKRKKRAPKVSTS